MSRSTVAQLVECVRAAGADRSPVCIRGGGTKDFYGETCAGNPLDMTGLSGISSYEPSELVITALAGTPLAEIETALAQHNQHLAFEPPRFAAGGTIGGMVAAGLSGPARASVGSVRDFVLGATLLNGRGQQLSFGGQVMKNVAGYDLSRALAGSLGILGIVLEVSLKVAPVPPSEATLEFEVDEATALQQLNAWAGQPLPLHASCWIGSRHSDGKLYVRLRGATAAVAATARQLGGRRIDPPEAIVIWNGYRDHSAHWFTAAPAELDLWRVSVPQTAAALSLSGEHVVQWHGGQRWYWLPPEQAKIVRGAANAVGGHATLFRRAAPGVARPYPCSVFDALSAPVKDIHVRLKQEFDPFGIFNPGRMYGDL